MAISASAEVSYPIKVAQVWSGHPVRFAVETTAGSQYVAFYNGERRMTVAARDLASADWEFFELPETVGWDSHNYITLAVDRAGHIHVSGNMHGSRLVYYRSQEPHDVSTLQASTMIGSDEKRMTYPVFLRGPKGALLYHYRDGKSGEGAQVFNIWDEKLGNWRRLLDSPLLDGLGQSNAYLAGPVAGPDGYFHLVWIWRDSPNGNDNHDLSYARSLDLINWETVTGERLDLPLTPQHKQAVVDPIATGEGLAGIAFGAGWDQELRAVVTYSKFDASGASQAFNARWKDGKWWISQASDWSYRWNLDRTGSLAHDVVTSPVTVDKTGRLVQAFRHLEAGIGTWVLDPGSLEPVETLPQETWSRELERVSSSNPGMEVRPLQFDNSGEYFLRWETLPIDRDRKRRGTHPLATALEVHRLPSTLTQNQSAARTPADLPRSPSELPEADSLHGPIAPTAFDDEVLEAEGARIGDITILVGDVFDSSNRKQSHWAYQTVNRLHYNTREQVIRRDLLFREGDLYSARLLRETERLLRTRRYLYDAKIRAIRHENGIVDLEVATRDVWTIDGGTNFSRSGGENRLRIQAKDLNFLGLGHDIGISHTDAVDRSGLQINFRNLNLLGSRTRLEAAAADNSDGERFLVKAIRPFFSLDSRWSAGVVLETNDRVEPFFELGERTSEFRQEFDFAELSWGRSRGLVNGHVWRWQTGFVFNRSRFSEVPGRTPPATLPEDRTLSYPWFSVDYVEDRYLEKHDLDSLDRTEDLQLGRRFGARLGWSSPDFGADEELFLLSGNFGHGFAPDPRITLLTGINAGSRWDGERLETLVVNGAANFFWRNWKNHLLHVDISATLARDLDDEQQILLGGDNGLRGYPLRFQAGDRRFLVTLEQRFFTNWEPLSLGFVGAAVFFDAGRAWFEDTPSFVAVEGFEDLGVLKDVGVGLRLSNSRSGRGNVLHLDVAFPLDRTDDIKGVQFLVTTKQTL